MENNKNLEILKKTNQLQYIQIKWGDKLKKYDMVNDYKILEQGKFIKYIPQNLDKMMFGIIKKIYINKNDNIIVLLKYPGSKFQWKINFSNHYIFQSNSVPKDKFLKYISKYVDIDTIINQNKKNQ